MPPRAGESAVHSASGDCREALSSNSWYTPFRRPTQHILGDWNSARIGMVGNCERENSMSNIGFHASHEQFAPSELLELVRTAEDAGFGCAMSSDHFRPWGPTQGQS